MVFIIVCIFSLYIPGKTLCVIIGTAIAIDFTLNKLGWYKPHIRHRVRINNKETSMYTLPDWVYIIDVSKKLRQKEIKFSEEFVSCNYAFIRICLKNPKSDILIVKPYDPDVLAGEKSFIQPHHKSFFENTLLPLDGSGEHPSPAPH